MLRRDKPSRAAIVHEFIRAFNEQDLVAFSTTLHPEVEMHSGRGLRRGVDAARDWATKKPGGVQQTVFLDGLHTREGRRRNAAIAQITRRWIWEEDGSPAGEEEMEWLFIFAGGLIRSWHPCDGRGQARQLLAEID